MSTMVVGIASQTEGWALHASSSRSSPRSTQRKLLDHQHTHRADSATADLSPVGFPETALD
jgi:hypothetical protein